MPASTIAARSSATVDGCATGSSVMPRTFGTPGLAAAASIGMRLRTSLASSGAPCSSKNGINSARPVWAAKCNAVSPCSLAASARAPSSIARRARLQAQMSASRGAFNPPPPKACGVSPRAAINTLERLDYSPSCAAVCAVFSLVSASSRYPHPARRATVPARSAGPSRRPKVA